MKAAKAIPLTMMVVVLQGSVALSQITPTEKAAAGGTCSTAYVGDNNAYNINCNGIGVDQGKKIVEILNRVLANQDLLQPPITPASCATYSGGPVPAPATRSPDVRSYARK
jgi:hypothetical protein